MKRRLRRPYRLLPLLGIDLHRTRLFLRGWPSYLRDLRELRRQEKASAEDFPLGRSYPCMGERSSDSGVASGHYFHQDLLVARRIFLNNPTSHVDVGSRVDGFIAHVASFRPVEILDIRPLAGSIPNVRFVQADLMAPLREELVGHCDSLSCLHAVEHFGLGRYGDPVNFDGHVAGLNGLHAILQKGGKFYFSVPIGPQRIEFNAHRVFSVAYLLRAFAGKYRIDQFSYVDDRGDLHENAPMTDVEARSSFGCIYGCGIFEMTKL